MNDQDLVNSLREHAEWVEGNQYETPITLCDDLVAAADRIANQNTHILALQKEIDGLRGQLREYLGTGLTPAEIKSMQGEHFTGLEMAKLHSALMELKKYQEADKGGRLVVLPKAPEVK